jgi:hypothetical protein
MKTKMGLKREKIIAFCAMIVFFVIGVVCYAAFPEKKPDQPIRIMFKSIAGKVLFSHKKHVDEDGYGLDCTDCHHYYEEGDLSTISCTKCHISESDEEEEVSKRSDALHSQCIGCHQKYGGGPDECSECHVL